MNINMLIVAGACFPLLSGTAINAAAAEAHSSGNVAIQSLENQLIEANRKKDVSAVMRLYAPNTNVVIFDVVPPRQFLSGTNWEKNVEGYFAAFEGPAGLEITDLNITVSGDLAYGYMIQHFFGQKRGGGNVDLSARVTDVYRKITGHWFIVHEHVSVPVNIETGQADLHSKP